MITDADQHDTEVTVSAVILQNTKQAVSCTTALTFWFLKDDVDNSLLFIDPDIIHLATAITRTLKVVPEDVITQQKVFTNHHLHRPARLFLLLCRNIITSHDCSATV